ncbi:MAG: FKBP-type peptidyl-prolyl cis-trans isomerase [Muribaculaceae bacterium]|jgi:FKBP-type peptidyl-prolyl cis-trans isomerase FklB|uniref:FKBP-type peptidyl-prolyl cis-trans isomerase n=1 Tax=Candidatus Limisoma sp. TaxID=3076476 RepID=UPI000AFFEAEF|nr:FKBP-type peptidyl-prolyl cis-trans isomerase [Muribaculaceae bacterium]
MDKLSYALGMSMGHNFKGTGIKTLNSADFAAGVASVYDGVKPEMTFDEAKRIVNEYFAKLEAEMQAEAAKQGEVNRKNGEAFLSENAKREGIKVTESGLQYEVLESGKGDSPKASDNVEVHYTGKLIDGTVFDSSVERGVPASFGVTQVIPGWVEALQLMHEGDKWRLYIPSDLAYGPNGAGGVIGPNMTLIFDVELLRVIKK